MTDKLREAAQLAIDALEEGHSVSLGEFGDTPHAEQFTTAITALRAALAQQDAQAVPQEPYCHIYEYDSHFGLHREFYPREWNGLKPNRCIPVYATTTPPEQCVELTVEEIGEAALSAGCDPACDDGALVVRLAHAVIEAYERKNGIK